MGGGGGSMGVGTLLRFERRPTRYWWRAAAPRGDAVTSIFDVSCGVGRVTIKDEDNLEMSLSILHVASVSVMGSRLGRSGRGRREGEDVAGAGGRGIAVSWRVKETRGTRDLSS